MISENLKQLLLQRDENSELDFKGLVEFLENSEYEFIGGKLRGVLGVATVGKAVFDIDWLSIEDNQLIFFVVLHEYAHLLRITKMGKDKIVSFFAEEDFDKFLDHIVGEEIIADRFGALMFHHFNKEVFPRYRTQRLHEETRREQYGEQIGNIHGMVTDEKSYDDMINLIIMEG